jgi:hypothetical protein
MDTDMVTGAELAGTPDNKPVPVTGPGVAAGSMNAP